MKRRQLRFLFAALALVACAAIFFAAQRVRRAPRHNAPRGFVTTDGTRFLIDGRAFSFVGANAAVMYGDDERERMPETLRVAAQDGIKVIRVWAFGEVDGREASAGKAKGNEWLYANPFRRGPNDWNEAAFTHLDRVLVEAARNHVRVQICLVNWWPDTGGVTQYLSWAGIRDAYDPAYPHGVNVERAMLFYTNEETRRLYRRHVELILTRRNTITGALYRDDPTILGYELMNEAQAPTGRAGERRAWVAEMSAYVKSLDPNHLVTPGLWGYRNARERREWIAEHSLPDVDYCDVHLYPRDDLDVNINSPEVLRDFIDNRAAAAISLDKPLVVGEFGIPPEGFNGHAQTSWFRAYFESAARARLGGAMFWIWTHVAFRAYGVTYTDARDQPLRAEFTRAARLLDSTASERAPADVRDTGRHLIPRQFAFTRDDADTSARPEIKRTDDERTDADKTDANGLLYRFTPEQAARGRFEKLGSGAGYIWGDGVGFFDYLVPARADDRRKVGEIVVRAYLQPTPPFDALDRVNSTRVTLLINGHDCGSRLVTRASKPHAPIQEWRVNSLLVRAHAALGKPLAVRFAVQLDADQPYGLTIANFPEGFDARGATPIEIEIK